MYAIRSYYAACWDNGWPVIGVDLDRNGIGEPVYVWQNPAIEKETRITSYNVCYTKLLRLKDVQKNTYLKNGHNYQDERLRLYLPGNGGLLYTVAMMCAGWDGCTVENPGFPKDGTWNVKWEDLKPVM